MVLLVLCLALSVVVSLLAAPAPTDVTAQEFQSNNGSGNYEFWSQLSDDTYRWQKGELRYTQDGNSYVFTSGGYAYYDHAKQVLRIVEFEADHNGYRPKISEEAIPPGGVPTRFGQGASGG